MMSIFPKMKKTTMLMFALFFSVIAIAQNAAVTGRVTDKDGVGIPSVSISSNGKVIGLTDGQGNFRVNTDPKGSLTFSSVGYSSKTESLGGKTNLEVSLATKANSDAGVVTVIGYGSAKKADVVSSVTRVGPKDFNKGPSQTVDQLIQGKVAGLVITRAGGDPNGSANIQLRGPGTLLGNTQPLYVIDGVPDADPKLVSPDDIASVDVLKDASATAIYGTKAANGVILMTTKRGKSGQMSVNYSGVVGFENVSSRIKMADASQIRAAWTKFGMGSQAANDDGANTDWQKVITRQGLSNNHNISFSGGTSNAKYIASVNYYDQKGIMLNSSTNRLTGRIGADFTGFDNKVRLSLNLANNFTNNSYVDYGTESTSPYFQALRYLPTMNVLNANGTYRNVPGRYRYYNPLQMLNTYSNKASGNGFQGNAKLGIDLASWLTYDLSLTYNNGNNNGNQFYNDDNPNLTNGDAYYQARQYYNSGKAKILENYFTAKKKFGDLSTKLLMGYSWEQRQGASTSFGTKNSFSPLAANNLNLYSSLPDGYNVVDANSSFTRKLISFYGRAEFNYLSKYLLNFTLRHDGSTVFGVNNKWATFPSVGFAWRLIEESFLKDNKIFSDLKLRASYGTSGEQGVDPYGSFSRYRSVAGTNFLYNGNWVSSLLPVQNANPDLKWQTTKMSNIGLDWAILNNKINGTIDVYSKKSVDLLYDYTVNVPPYQFPTMRSNDGSVSNKGIEFSINTENMHKKDFSWTSTFNIAFNKNNVVNIVSPKFSSPTDDGTRYYTGPLSGQGLSNEVAYKLKSGLPLGTFFLYNYNGHDQYGNNYYQNASGNSVLAGAINSVVDQYDTYGSALPKMTAGFGNTFTYKKFDFNVFMRGAFGNKILNAIGLNFDKPGSITQYNALASSLDYFTNDQNRPSTKYLEKGDFVRIDNVTLGYNLGAVKALKYLRTARVNVNVQNLATFTKYSGIDPELNLGGLTPGTDMGIYPKTRTVSIGLNLGF